ncbi:hypothetical protein GRF29_161g219417 [Pseudopithomyces chartarum]|uniref:Serine hydrolase domain-containing protein n=1 Tax=Pseudopithomyces chartarum TaxID=1892770 RepID=A0AAN6LTU6_9PLEO|nr:hypothetical protein GRF29_161g219417 [Pseudopithomyces chartarum]
MRFLMLHGGGTNNQIKIFELQTAAIRYELGSQHSFEFVEGPIPGFQASGIESLVRPEDNFFVYYDRDSAGSISKAVDDLQSYLEHDGPFDAILAFSQGCGLAATWCYQAQQMNQVPVKGIVFFSGEPAHSLVGLSRGEIRDLDPHSEEGILRIPTVHVWGTKDVTNPERNKLLYGQCNAANRGRVILHTGAHELPGSGMEKAVQEIVQSIRRLVGRK